jgi:hypothetical protein
MREMSEPLREASLQPHVFFHLMLWMRFSSAACRPATIDYFAAQPLRSLFQCNRWYHLPAGETTNVSGSEQAAETEHH